MMDNECVQSRAFKLPKSYRTCFVPLCANTSKNSPSKVFVHIPSNLKTKKQWFKLARRAQGPSNSHFYCCEDHLNLEEDLVDFMRFRLFGTFLKLKPDALPRYFDCQPDRANTAKPSPRIAHQKLQHKRKIDEILLEHESRNRELEVDNVILRDNVHALPSTPSPLNIEQVECSVVPEVVFPDVPEKENFSSNSCGYGGCSPLKKRTALQEIREANLHATDEPNSQFSERRFVSKGIQVTGVRHHYRSVGTIVKCRTAEKSTSTSDLHEIPPLKPLVHQSMENNSALHDVIRLQSHLTLTSNETFDSKTLSEYKPSASEILETEVIDLQIKRDALSITMNFISKYPKFYIGVNEDWLFILDHLSIATSISISDIKLTLMKIKLDDTFVRLSHAFGMGPTKATTVFRSSVNKLAKVLRKLIYFPDKKSIKRTMPIPFRLNYFEVESTIDAFEIQIEKPSDSVHQALTWSEYKRNNTLKFLISCSPDGMINFISRGYGGRISDTTLFEVSGIMNVLPSGCTVMADRGFKQIGEMLAAKNCKLVRPPSVASNCKLSKGEVKETKRIASLRIHIERVIERLGEFHMLEPHATLSNYIMPHIDSVVVIASALINLQSPIIRT